MPTKPLPGVMDDPLHPLSKGCICHLLFNEGAGELAYDVSGHGNHGALKNMLPNVQGSKWQGSKFGGGLSFDGANDYGDLGPTYDFDNRNTTVSVWVKSSSNSNDMRIVVGNSNYSYRWALVMHNGHIIMSYNDGLNHFWDTANQFNDNKWHNIVGLRNSESPLIYVDSILQTNKGSLNTNFSLSGNAKIGAKMASTYLFNGSIDNIRIYNRTLRAEEIKQLYHDPFCNLICVPLWQYYVPAAAAAGLARSYGYVF